MTEAPKELYFYDDWLAQHTKGKLLCGNNRYLHENHVDALEAQASAEGFDRGVKEAQPIVESLRAELHSLYDAIGFDPLDLENGHDNARAAIDALLKAEREKALREAVEVCTNVIKNYDVMEPGKPNQFASLKIQKAAKGMVSLTREDILALITKDADNG